MGAPGPRWEPRSTNGARAFGSFSQQLFVRQLGAGTIGSTIAVGRLACCSRAVGLGVQRSGWARSVSTAGLRVLVPASAAEQIPPRRRIAGAPGPLEAEPPGRATTKGSGYFLGHRILGREQLIDRHDEIGAFPDVAPEPSRSIVVTRIFVLALGLDRAGDERPAFTARATLSALRRAPNGSTPFRRPHSACGPDRAP